MGEKQKRGKILTKKHGSILIITINRPEVKNAFDEETAKEMSMAIDELEEDNTLFMGIIHGSGGTFSSGADLKASAKGERIFTEKRGGFGIFAKPPTKPLIAAVEGYAVAGGLELCLTCDVIIAANDVQMGLPEVRHNLVALGGGLFRLPKRIPYHLVMELALTGDIVSVKTFFKLGLVNKLVEPGQTLEEAIKFAERLQENGPLALRASKQIIQHSMSWSEEEAWEKQMKFAKKAFDSEDRIEGLRAFNEKRKPEWKNR